MRTSRYYDDYNGDNYSGSGRDAYWERRLRNAVRGREGFAWGAFFIGFIIGGIIF